jgi:hypothetical protein
MVLIEYAACAAVGLVVGLTMAYFAADALQKQRLERAKEYISELEDVIDSYKKAEWGDRGRKKQAEQSERMDAAMMEIAVAIKAGKPPMDAIKELIPKYPDIALRLAKKGMKL